MMLSAFYSIAQQNKLKISDTLTIKKNITLDSKLNSSKSDTINFNSIVSKKKIIPSDSSITIVDSTNYLPRTSAAMHSKVKYSANDSIVYDEYAKLVDLFGDAKVYYEDLSNQSDHIIINLNKNTISSLGRLDSMGNLQGTPEFKQGSNDYKAVKITYNYVTKKGYLSEFKTTEGEGHIKGAKVKRDPDNNFYLEGAYYTTCDADEPHFMIIAEKLKVIPNRKVITGPANLMIEGLRTPLFVPFGIFPLKRGQQSGVIIPQWGGEYGGGTATRGYFLRDGGYYFGLGEKYDLTLRASVWANASYELKSKFNYAARYRFLGGLNLEYLMYNNGSSDDPNFNTTKNYKIQWNHRMDQKARPGVNFKADVNLMSSTYFSQSINPATVNSYSSTSQSSIAFSKSLSQNKVFFSTNARISQNLQKRTLGVSFPNAALNVTSFNPLKPKTKPTAEYWYENINLSYSGSFSNNVNTTDTLLFRNRTQSEWLKYIDSAFNYGFHHSIPINTSFKLFKYYQLSVGINYNEIWAPNTIRKVYMNTSEQKGVIKQRVSGFERWFSYYSNASISTKWYGQKNFAKGKIAAIRHVVDPSIGFVYQPDFSDESWGFYKSYQVDSTGKTGKYSIFEESYGGAPSQGKQGNITFGLNNNLEMKVRVKNDTSFSLEKVKILESFSIGGHYNAFADSMKLSIINLRARTTLFKSIYINSNINIDPYKNILVSNGTSKTISRVNKYYSDEGSLGKIIYADLGLSYSLNSETLTGNKNNKEARKKEMLALGYSPFSIPWNISFNYNINYVANKTDLYRTNSNYVQTLGFGGSLNPTSGWSVNYNSGWDFVNNKISSLNVNLKRDLHCWVFTFDWSPITPFGYQFFFFQINVKSSVLQELKYPKQKNWLDNRNL